MEKDKSQQIVELSQSIVDKQKEIIKLRKRLNEANKKYQETRQPTLEPWEYKHFLETISILEKEEEMMKEERKLIQS